VADPKSVQDARKAEMAFIKQIIAEFENNKLPSESYVFTQN
jgi:hypothetical protein